MSAGRLVNKARGALMTQSCTLALPKASPSPTSQGSATVRPLLNPHRSFVTMNKDDDSNHLEAIFQKKRSFRSKIRKELKNMTPIQRSQEDNAIQSIVLKAPWFKSSKSLCAYVSCDDLREVDTSKILSEILCNPAEEGHTQSRKNLYVPLVEDRNSNMRMLKISSFNDLTANSMNILEPAPVDCDGNQREDVMQASEPVDLFIIPGLAFDRSGRRLGRSGGYYDMFLKKYEELAKERNWKHPLLVALSYSVQIVDEGAIAVTPNDVPVDAIVSPAGLIPTSPVAMKTCD
uniref:5-formyltetrahydrofolate cyclo-ligase n=1 Tax=Davidia involucrata TaxID=16924 RepID=A0A5B7BFS2_DAVIN